MNIIKILPKNIRALYYANFYTPKRIQPQAMPEFYLDKTAAQKVTFADWKNYIAKGCCKLKSFFTK